MFGTGDFKKFSYAEPNAVMDSEVFGNEMSDTN